MLSTSLKQGVLTISGTNLNDSLSVSSSGSSIVIQMNGLSSTVRPGKINEIDINGLGGDDTINIAPSVKTIVHVDAGAGNDSIYDRGAAGDLVHGGIGDDLIVSIGGGSDQNYGDAGYDSFWGDNSEAKDISLTESAAGHVHNVGQFYSYVFDNGTYTSTRSVNKTLDGANLTDPTTWASSSANFSSQPLFGLKGPSAGDVYQGNAGDCYFLATLSTVAKTDADRIRQSVVSLGDGTFCVQFMRNGTPTFVRIDGDLPVDSFSKTPIYAKPAGDGSTWAPIMEKAWAFFRSDKGSYASVDYGWMSEAYSALGSTASSMWNTDNPTGQQILDSIATYLNQGKSVTFATLGAIPTNCPCIGSHAYSVDHVVTDALGHVTAIVIRNPWGFDGAGTDSNYNDGLVTLNASQAKAVMWSVQSAFV